ncbi:poly(A) RNA polymerase, mitochondrial [Lucilia sericata]|uniref:poly(A) RNA polymerase, mitochondrial n=1 Tax=Lucilia sericata TaxID=13632 RepID=UPI0018A84766|nr:poly(A) RNA polymerase, mitochondrial [Lucilia sericata]
MYKIVKKCCNIKNYSKYVLKNKYSTTPVGVPAANKVSFDDFVLQRQQEATRSVVVQVSSEKSFPELYNYCSAFGNIVGAHHYCVRHDDVQHYILLEYENPQQASEAIDSSAYNEELIGVPARSPFLWFRASGKKALKRKPLEESTKCNLNVVDGNNIVELADLNATLKECPHIEQQMSELYHGTKLNDLGIRLRFLAAYQVQQSIVGMFPLANALPFGSSVNGFGKMGCDLDLILRLDQECKGPEAKKRPDSRLVFHTKENLTNGRSQTQRQMESIGDMLQLFLPGVCHVRRILQARVPIIKYHHEHLNLEIDLSMSNLSGFYMSELLYMFGEFDERVKPLTFCIRRWASCCGLTNPSPGRWISNFSLTCLVIFFLQQTKQPVLPAINTLIKSAKQEDIRITEDGINCTFARDFQSLGFRSNNTSKTSELLLQFFEFYSQFDFQNKAISLNEGRAIAKPDHAALYIVNPLEQLLNVSKNVSLEECERLRIEVRNAAWVLESEVENQYQNGEMDKSQEPWGLLNLFKTPEKTIIRPNMFFKPRILEVSDLFDKTETMPSTPPGNSVTSTSMGLKNNQVKQQIDNIKSNARQDLKQMRLNGSAPSNTTKASKSSKRSR